jgi:3'(2'), 5'-bisphosphate nucleotidase
VNDHELAADLAERAGHLLVALRARMEATRAWPEDIMDAGDKVAHDFLFAALGDQRPADAVLSEEGHDDLRRLKAERVWIVDPLDGTKEYGESGRVDWAVHVALWCGGELIAGAVALPAAERTYSTGVALPVRDDSGRGPRPRLVTSRFRNPHVAAVIANALGADAIRMGSAGAKAMAVVLGHADIYAHAGGMYEWDSAAPVAVAAAAGLHVSRIDGSPLRYNQRDPWLPDLLICRPDLAEAALTAVRTVGRY